MARNNLTSKGKDCTLTITAGMVCGIALALPKYLRLKKQREILALEIDRTYPWGFFDGASQNNLCEGGAILHLGENQSFELITGLGEGSNNWAELLSLKLLLIFAAEKGCRTIKVFGDSLNVINWVKRIQTCRDLLLCNILQSIWDVMESFELITYTHVYRENNNQANSASKEGLLLDPGMWKVKEQLGDDAFAYYHCPFLKWWLHENLFSE